MNAVATGPPAQRDDQVTRLAISRMATVGQQPDTATEDQRIAQVTHIIENRTVDGGQSQLITIVANPSDHAVGNPARMENASGQLVVREILWAKAEYIGGRNWPRRNADNIAHHAADARIRPAKRFKRGGVVVRFNLEGKVKLLIKGDDPSVVDKGRAQPRGVNFLGGAANILFE